MSSSSVDEADPSDPPEPSTLEEAQQALHRETAMRRSLEERLRRVEGELSEVTSQFQDFLYIVSHDLNAPMRKILAFSERLSTNCGDQLSEKGRHYVERMSVAAQNLQGLLEGVLTISRVPRMRSEPRRVDLEEVVRRVATELAPRLEAAGAELVYEDLPAVFASGEQMEMLIRNLLDNALKFADPARPPHIELRAVPPADAGSGVCVEVRDNGIGFEPRFSDDVFRIFQRLHPPDRYAGNGIGLTVCRTIVSANGGTISVQSTPGEGSCFRFTLPAPPPAES